MYLKSATGLVWFGLVKVQAGRLAPAAAPPEPIIVELRDGVTSARPQARRGRKEKEADQGTDRPGESHCATRARVPRAAEGRANPLGLARAQTVSGFKRQLVRYEIARANQDEADRTRPYICSSAHSGSWP